MSTQAFQLDPSLANMPLEFLRRRYEEMTPEERRIAGFVRQATQGEFDQAQPSQGGAPADFAGRVLQNAGNVQVSDDTDSGIPALRLPNGVSATTGAYTGTPKLDVSNPAQAQVLPAAMQTVGSEWAPVKEEASGDASAWKPVAEAAPPAEEKPSAASRLKENFLSALGVTTDEGAKQFFRHPINTMMESINAQGELATKAKEAYDKGDYKAAVQHGLNYLIPFIGQNTDKAGEQLKEGDIAGGIGTTLGTAVPLVAGSPEVKAATTEHIVTPIKNVARATVEKASKITPKQAAQAVGGGTGAVAGHGTFSAPGAYYGAKTAGKITEGVLGKERANAPIFKKPVNAAATRAAEIEAPTPKPESKLAPVERDATLNKRNIPEYAGEEEPANAMATRAKEAPETGGTKEGAARDTELFQQAKKELGKDASISQIAQRAQELKTASPYTGSESRVVPATQNIRENLAMVKEAEAAPSRMNNSMAERLQDKALSQEMNWDLEKHGYKADSEARREFIARNSTGTTKGELIKQANEARANAPIKITEDLTPALEKSVEYANAKKGGVMTTAEPGMLAERWGTSEKAIADTDAQLRGKSAGESQKYIDQLAEAYKKGHPVQPVMETRDAANNLIEVDGRHRALAAKKAGITRIPVIVRRIGVASR